MVGLALGELLDSHAKERVALTQRVRNLQEQGSMDYLSLLLAPSGSRAKVPSRLPVDLVDRFTDDALMQGMFVLDTKISKDGLPILHVEAQNWEKRDIERSMAILHKQNPKIIASVKRSAGTGDLLLTLDRRSA